MSTCVFGSCCQSVAFTLNSAEVYIYCVRINKFNAWPISAPAYFSPCRTFTSKVAAASLYYQMLVEKHFVVSSYTANRLVKTPAQTLSCYSLMTASVILSVCLPVCWCWRTRQQHNTQLRHMLSSLNVWHNFLRGARIIRLNYRQTADFTFTSTV